MKKNIINLILSFNALIWIVISTVNYVGIMLQLEEDIIRIFLWSIITVMMYGVIVYSLTIVINRIFLIYQYRHYKIKYFNNKAFGRQILLLTGVILYLYVACFYNYHFLGLIPMLIFFSNILTNLGRFYVYDNEHLLLIEDFSKEFLVEDIKVKDERLTIWVLNTRSLDKKEIELNTDPMETKFITGFITKEMKEEVVA